MLLGVKRLLFNSRALQYFLTDFSVSTVLRFDHNQEFNTLGSWCYIVKTKSVHVYMSGFLCTFMFLYPYVSTCTYIFYVSRYIYTPVCIYLYGCKGTDESIFL